MDLRTITAITGNNDNYAEVLKQTKALHGELADAHKRGDWDTVHVLTKQIAKLYAPNDSYVATVIEYLVDTTFTRAWFASADREIERLYS